jgi:hypothetical protein
MAADLPSCEVDLARDHSVLLVSRDGAGAMARSPPISAWLWAATWARRATGAAQSASSCRSLATPPSAPQSFWAHKARHNLGPAESESCPALLLPLFSACRSSGWRRAILAAALAQAVTAVSPGAPLACSPACLPV